MNYQSIVSPDSERIAELIFELASQLNIERAQRIALELALARAGVLDAQAIEGLARDAEFRSRSAAALDKSMGKLMRVLTQHADERAPLRTDTASVREEH